MTVAVGEITDKALHIRLWLMSCRVLKRGMESAMMDMLMEKAKGQGIETVYGYYYPTAKNEMVKDFYSVMGFEDSGDSWSMKPVTYKAGNHHIKVL